MTNYNAPENQTTHRVLLIACATALAVAFTVAVPQPARADLVTPPHVPSNIEVPAGNTAFLEGRAFGTQNYICLPSGWTFFGPQATLFNDLTQQVITHFLSPNPAEGGTARATWQHSGDTSTVWAMAIATYSNPGFDARGDIPLLLLRVVGSQDGPTDGQTLTPTTFIHRLNTSGGVAPSIGCSTPAQTLARGRSCLTWRTTSSTGQMTATRSEWWPLPTPAATSSRHADHPRLARLPSRPCSRRRRPPHLPRRLARHRPHRRRHGRLELRPPAHPLRGRGLAHDVLPGGPGALRHVGGRLGLGAGAVDRGAAGGVGDATATRGGGGGLMSVVSNTPGGTAAKSSAPPPSKRSRFAVTARHSTHLPWHDGCSSMGKGVNYGRAHKRAGALHGVERHCWASGPASLPGRPGPVLGARAGHLEAGGERKGDRRLPHPASALLRALVGLFPARRVNRRLLAVLLA
jgi:hypothetical protein